MHSLNYTELITVSISENNTINKKLINTSDVKASRPDWPRGQNFGLGLEALDFGLEDLVSASKFWEVLIVRVDVFIDVWLSMYPESQPTTLTSF